MILLTIACLPNAAQDSNDDPNPTGTTDPTGTTGPTGTTDPTGTTTIVGPDDLEVEFLLNDDPGSLRIAVTTLIMGDETITAGQIVASSPASNMVSVRLLIPEPLDTDYFTGFDSSIEVAAYVPDLRTDENNNSLLDDDDAILSVSDTWIWHLRGDVADSGLAAKGFQAGWNLVRVDVENLLDSPNFEAVIGSIDMRDANLLPLDQTMFGGTFQKGDYDAHDIAAVPLDHKWFLPLPYGTDEVLARGSIDGSDWSLFMDGRPPDDWWTGEVWNSAAIVLGSWVSGFLDLKAACYEDSPVLSIYNNAPNTLEMALSYRATDLYPGWQLYQLDEGHPDYFIPLGANTHQSLRFCDKWFPW